jgi:hypothetical protein
MSPQLLYSIVGSIKIHIHYDLHVKWSVSKWLGQMSLTTALHELWIVAGPKWPFWVLGCAIACCANAASSDRFPSRTTNCRTTSLDKPRESVMHYVPAMLYSPCTRTHGKTITPNAIFSVGWNMAFGLVTVLIHICDPKHRFIINISTWRFTAIHTY